MPEPARIVLTLGVFALTLAGVLLRPKGWHEAWWTMLGAGLMLLLHLATPAQAARSVWASRDVLLFLLALLLLSALLDRSGFFEWAAIQAARQAGGDAHRLYRNVFFLGAIITATLSLDTTAVILTPLVLAFVRRLRLPARPYILACAFVANTASLLLPVSNLTNLLFVGAFHWSFVGFAARMALPQMVALLVNYAGFRWLFRRELPARLEVSALPDPLSVVPNLSYFRGALLVLTCVLAGYFAAPFVPCPPYVVGFAGCAVLAVWGAGTRQVRASLVRDVAWPLFPFVAGLFVVVQGVENLGLAAPAAAWLGRQALHPLAAAGAAALGAGAASNIVNNLPAALLAIGVLKAAHAAPPVVYAALLGMDIGPNLTLFGSLATMLVLTTARKAGEDVRGADFFKVGLLVMPLTLGAAALALWLTWAVRG